MSNTDRNKTPAQTPCGKCGHAMHGTRDWCPTCKWDCAGPTTIYAPGHFSAGSLERPEPRL